MVEIQHPFVAMMERADVVRDKNFAVITRRYEARGSLKDIMHGVRLRAASVGGS